MKKGDESIYFHKPHIKGQRNAYSFTSCSLATSVLKYEQDYGLRTW